MQSSIDLTAFERSLWLARGDTCRVPFIGRFLDETIMLLNLGGLPVFELTEAITPGLVNAGWQLYFNRRLPMVPRSLALIVQPVPDWEMRRSWALVASSSDDRASMLIEFIEPEAPAGRSHVLICGSILPAKPWDSVIPLFTQDVVAAMEGGATPEALASLEDQSRRAANRAIGAIWTHFVSETEISVPHRADIISARKYNRTPPQHFHAVHGGISIRVPHLQL